MTVPALLDFADIQPSVMPCYPLSQQIAEKVHTYTRPYATSECTRVKDWVDLLLMAELGKLHGPTLLQALHATFNARHTHPLSTHLPKPSSAWATTFRHQSREMGLGYRALAEASEAIALFLDPVLQDQARGDLGSKRVDVAVTPHLVPRRTALPSRSQRYLRRQFSRRLELDKWDDPKHLARREMMRRLLELNAERKWRGGREG